MRENRLYSLSGGRRPARKRASSDPTPVNLSNKEEQSSAEMGEGRAWTVENVAESDTSPTQSGERVSHGLGDVRKAAQERGCTPILLRVSPPLIHGKSRMRRRARTDLYGGRSAMVVPTVTAAWVPDFEISLHFWFTQKRHLLAKMGQIAHKAASLRRRRMCCSFALAGFGNASRT